MGGWQFGARPPCHTAPSCRSSAAPDGQQGKSLVTSRNQNLFAISGEKGKDRKDPSWGRETVLFGFISVWPISPPSWRNYKKTSQGFSPLLF